MELPLEEVPHFVELEEQVGYYYLDLTNGWLRKQGYPFEVLMRHMPQAANHKWYVKRKGDQWVKHGVTIPGYWIMGVESKLFPGSHHVVVARGDRIVWDVSPHFGEPAYDNKPYVFDGFLYTFHVTNPARVPKGQVY